jgi:hypothetical protein
MIRVAPLATARTGVSAAEITGPAASAIVDATPLIVDDLDSVASSGRGALTSSVVSGAFCCSVTKRA